MKTLSRDIKRIFPTLLFKINLDIDSNSIINNIKKLEEENHGNKMFNPTYHFESHDDLYKLEDFKEISDLILDETSKILDHMHVIRKNHYIIGMWGNITDVNHQHHFHIHPNSFLSGILYLNCPVDASQTTFKHPLSSTFMIQPEYSEFDFDNSHMYSEQPEVGSMLVWTSNCMHGVFNHNRNKINNIDEKRIVLVFNVMIETDVNKHTMKITY